MSKPCLLTISYKHYTIYDKILLNIENERNTTSSHVDHNGELINTTHNTSLIALFNKASDNSMMKFLMNFQIADFSLDLLYLGTIFISLCCRPMTNYMKDFVAFVDMKYIQECVRPVNPEYESSI